MQLIISEKPAASEKIAKALGKAEKKRVGKVYYFEVDIDGTKVLVAPAVGHLFGLAEKEKTWKYPVFDLEWKPTYEISKSSAFAKPYFENLKKLAKKADDFVVATDYDIEGEVIGLNIVRFLAKQKDAKRMKFSTLTAKDLKKAYENMTDTLNWGQAEAGQTRHWLDWLWGVNLSKAVTDSVYRITHRFQTLSIGRVQGPALAFLTERERAIAKFISKPYWQIFANFKFGKQDFQAIHKTEKFWGENEANLIFEKVKDKPAEVSEVKARKSKVNPPVPFDLTSLQVEAWRVFRIKPKQTLNLAQDLYTNAFISYPRTSSQKLPPALNLKQIITKLAMQKEYNPLASKLLVRKTLKPNEGKKSDPAHPAIHPTGEIPKGLDKQQKQIYDLIVKRFFSVFVEAGERETTTITFDIEKEPFKLKGTRTTKKGWQEFYEPYVKKEEVELPALKKGENHNQATDKIEKQTEPPKRYTQASIIKALEKENLGTKATRANIVDTLYNRGYINGTSIHVSKLGQEIVATFEKYAPDILSKELTVNFEKEMDNIREKKITKEKVIDSAKKALTKAIKKFDEHKLEIGKELATSLGQAIREASTLMKCRQCNTSDIRVITSKKSGKRFLACSGYPKCKLTWPLPQKGKLEITEHKCPVCETPKIRIITKGRKPWDLCPNPFCPTKQELKKKTETIIKPVKKE